MTRLNSRLLRQAPRGYLQHDRVHSRKSLLLYLMMGIVVTLLLSGCTGNPDITPTQNTPGQNTPTQSSQLQTTPIQNTPVQNTSVTNEGVYYFPVQRSLPTMSAGFSIEGKLVVKDGYIRVEDRVWNLKPESRLVIWPPGYSLDTSHHTAQILNEKGRLAAQVGDYVRMESGGNDSEVTNLITGQTRLGESFTYQGSSVSASTVEVIPYPFLFNSTGDLEADQSISTIEGTLVLDRSYLRINSSSGKSYLAIGLDSYIAMCLIGHHITASGAEVVAESLKKYVWNALPEDAEGPFWIVTDIKPY